jgi:hypothetical protein
LDYPGTPHHASSTILNPDPNGLDFRMNAGPSEPGGVLAGSRAVLGDDAMGYIKVETAFVGSGEKVGNVVASSYTRVPLSFDKAVAGAQNFVNNVNAMQIRYNPLGINSNTIAHSLPVYLGGARAQPPVWAPGSARPFP